jgi:hypothetical protein
LLEISEGTTEVPEVTLLYVEILGTKMAFEKKVPEKDTNHFEHISVLSFYYDADNFCAEVRRKRKTEYLFLGIISHRRETGSISSIWTTSLNKYILCPNWQIRELTFN